MANPFDQFDAPAAAQSAAPAAGNPFDQFDAPAARPQSAEKGGIHWPSLSSVFNGMVNGAQGTVDYLTTPDPSKPTLSGIHTIPIFSTPLPVLICTRFWVVTSEGSSR